MQAQIIHIAEEELIFEPIKFNKKSKENIVSKSIAIQNIGDTELIIEDIITSCSCTLLEEEIETINKIAAQESIKINIAYKAKSLGNFKKGFSIKSNAINSDKFGENHYFIKGHIIE